MPEVFEPGSYDLPAMGQQQTKHRDNGRLSTSLHEASLLHTGRWLVKKRPSESLTHKQISESGPPRGRSLIPGKTVF